MHRIVLLLTIAFSSLASAADQPGCKDHPLFPTRMPGYEIYRLRDEGVRRLRLQRHEGPQAPRGGQVHLHHLHHPRPEGRAERPGDRPQLRGGDREDRRHVVAIDPNRWVNGKVDGGRQGGLVPGREGQRRDLAARSSRSRRWSSTSWPTPRRWARPQGHRPRRRRGHLLRHRQGGGEARVDAGAGAGREAARRRRLAEALGRGPHRHGREDRRQHEAVAGPRGGRRQGAHHEARRRGGATQGLRRGAARRRWRRTTPTRAGRRTAASNS